MAKQAQVFLSRDHDENPLTAGWVHVFLPYCDGASWSGDSTAVDPSGKTLYFRGLAIREAVVRSLRETAGFDHATDLIVGGFSAGALAVYLHLDWWAAQAPPTAKVRGMPDSGWFMPGDYERHGKSHYSAIMANLFTMVNASVSLPAACVQAKGPLCLYAMHVIAYVTTPILVLNSRFDASMGPGHYDDDNGMGAGEYNCTSFSASPCNEQSVTDFGNYIASSMRELVRPPNGAYLDACFHHCSTSTFAFNIHMHGTNTSFAAAEWYEYGSEGLPNGGWWDQGDVQGDDGGSAFVFEHHSQRCE